MAALPVTCVWLATGNNPSLSLEVARRTISSRLDAGIERPWAREGFRHPSLRRWAKENRGDLVWAALTLIQAWVMAGMPRGEKTLGSYESYAEVMGGILEVADIPGFLENQDRVVREAEVEIGGWTEACQAWWTEFHDQPVGADLIFGVVVHKRLLVETWGGRNDHSGRTRFGIALAKMRDRVVGGFKILEAPADTHGKVRRYMLTELRGLRGVAGALTYPNSQSTQAPLSRVSPEIPNNQKQAGSYPPQGPATPRNNDPWDEAFEPGEEGR